jgi:hypothetical protein
MGRLTLQKKIKAIRIDSIVLEILILVLGSGLILAAGLALIVQMEEDLIALELTAKIAASARP